MKLQNFRRNERKRKILVGIGLSSLFLLASLYLYKTYALFIEEKHFNVINGTVQDPGDIYFAYYVDGEITRSMPKQNTGYTLNVENSTCTNGVISNWDNADYYTRTRCNLYFEKLVK